MSKLCNDCAHYEPVAWTIGKCKRMGKVYDDHVEYASIATARSPMQACGPEAERFSPKTEWEKMKRHVRY